MIPFVDLQTQYRRLKPEIDPFSFAALLLGTCHQYVFIKYFQGHDPFPVPEDQFVAGIVQTLLHGATPLK